MLEKFKVVLKTTYNKVFLKYKANTSSDKIPFIVLDSGNAF